MQWGDTEAIVSMVFACTGIFVTGWVALVFIRHNNTAVVKASTRELSYIILVGEFYKGFIIQVYSQLNC